MGKMKQRTDAHVKDSEQKDFSCLTSSSTRVGIMVSRGEEVVRHICLMLMVFKIHDYLLTIFKSMYFTLEIKMMFYFLILKCGENHCLPFDKYDTVNHVWTFV